VASSGSHNITFEFSEQFLRQKVDRFYHYADYWIWPFPNVKPAIDYSMVLQAGSDGWACFTRGQNNFFSADPILTDYLIITSQKFAVPKMVVYFNSQNASLIASTITNPLRNVTLPTLTDPASSITLVFNATSYAPYMVRTFEEHAIFGNSTSDVLLSNYQPIEMSNNRTILQPHRFQTIWNSAETLEDVLIESIIINPGYPEEFFLMHSNFSSPTPKSNPAGSEDYTRGEVHEFFETWLVWL
jgi:hypothetical protein